MNWYLHALRHYADFSGRARRMEYWMFLLFNLLIYALLWALAVFAHVLGAVGAIVVFVYGLAMIIPHLSVSVRRLHDTGKSGWWILIGLIPLIGWLVLLYFYVQEGEAGSNAYGPNPKGTLAVAPA